MNSSVPRPGKKRVLLGLALTVYLYALLEPTAWLFYELHHLTGVGGIYWGYSIFRGAGYYFGQWDYQLVACLIIGLLVALPWWEYLKSMLRRRP